MKRKNAIAPRLAFDPFKPSWIRSPGRNPEYFRKRVLFDEIVALQG